MITGRVMATPKKITLSEAVLIAASHTVMRPITMSGKMLCATVPPWLACATATAAKP